MPVMRVLSPSSVSPDHGGVRNNEVPELLRVSDRVGQLSEGEPDTLPSNLFLASKLPASYSRTFILAGTRQEKEAMLHVHPESVQAALAPELTMRPLDSENAPPAQQTTGCVIHAVLCASSAHIRIRSKLRNVHLKHDSSNFEVEHPETKHPAGAWRCSVSTRTSTARTSDNHIRLFFVGKCVANTV